MHGDKAAVDSNWQLGIQRLRQRVALQTRFGPVQLSIPAQAHGKQASVAAGLQVHLEVIVLQGRERRAGLWGTPNQLSCALTGAAGRAVRMMDIVWIRTLLYTPLDSPHSCVWSQCCIIQSHGVSPKGRPSMSRMHMRDALHLDRAVAMHPWQASTRCSMLDCTLLVNRICGLASARNNVRLAALSAPVDRR